LSSITTRMFFSNFTPRGVDTVKRECCPSYQNAGMKGELTSLS
jgi:hypothetical protein